MGRRVSAGGGDESGHEHPRPGGIGQAETWPEILRSERMRVGLTQAELALRASVSLDAIRKYEHGTRQPSREVLEKLLEVLEVPYGTAHLALISRGFHHPSTRFPVDERPEYHFKKSEMQAFVELFPWPMFAVNELGECGAANQAAQALWMIDLGTELDQRTRSMANMFVALAEPRFVERIANWNDLFRIFVGIYKAVAASRVMMENPGALFSEILADFANTNPAMLGRLFEFWQTTPPIGAKVQWTYPVIWREPGFPEIRFQAIVNPASEPEGIGFNSWIPTDAASHAAFDAVMASRPVKAAPSRAKPSRRGPDNPTGLSPRR